MTDIAQHSLAEMMRLRRTIAPKKFTDEDPDHDAVIQAIEVARYAPNHHRTEPCRFYLLDVPRIQRVGELYGELVQGIEPTEESRARGQKKAKEWGSAPGLLVVTQFTPRDSALVVNKPAVIKEDYATCCCIVQNLLLLLESQNIAAKWSTGPVWEHPHFQETVGIPHTAPDEEVVALIFYGKHQEEPTVRELAPLGDSLMNYR
jgi:nitroreductase